jgi:hypothetical protein
MEDKIKTIQKHWTILSPEMKRMLRIAGIGEENEKTDFRREKTTCDGEKTEANK